MGLNKTALKAAIKSAQQAASGSANIAQAQEIYASTLANAIDAFVKSGQVDTIVNTTGSPSTHTGTGVGAIT